MKYTLIIIAFFLMIQNSYGQIVPQGFLVGPEIAADSVIIGTQIWKVKNLDVTTYNDATSITNVTGNLTSITSGAYSNYNEDAANAVTYGKLYNWYVASSGKACPVGWRVPSDADWIILTNYLATNGASSSSTASTSNASVAGGVAKEIGTTHWTTPNTSASDAYGFTGLPGGWKDGSTSTYLGLRGQFWSSTDYSATVAGAAIRFTLYYDSNDLIRASDQKYFAFSIRCIKN
ncbi:MAG: fibrobacter succinogenes major paralogous domain-containing protein [Bacteroidetes bacterium]|jgi:uncharacterized protein (TIGR02145 family)|nr:fibrobacter succinogenes major paralogous domain-containing protein [Bacteroidota bacterium]